MVIVSEDNKRMVDIGNSDIWHSVYSTIEVRLGRFKKKVPMAMAFFENAGCKAEDAMETARQFNMIRDALSQYDPEKAVYDCNNMKLVAPWKNKLSPVITSCANLYTTAEGQDLLFEVVSILCYASIKRVNVKIM